MNTWEIYRGGLGSKEFRWRVVASNGRIVGASSEGYHNRKDCAGNAIRIGGPRALETQDTVKAA